MQPGDNLIEAAGSNHGVLSHRLGQPLRNLLQTEGASFDEADQKADVTEDGKRPKEGFGRGGRRGRDGALRAPGVEKAFLEFARFVAVVGRTASVGLSFAVRLAAAERTPQIVPARIARVGEKENAAVPTASQALAQPGQKAQDRSQQHAIREDQAGHGAAPIPIRRETKMLPDLAGKKPRLWLWIPRLLKHPLRYRNGSPPSRWRKGNFLLRRRSFPHPPSEPPSAVLPHPLDPFP